MHDVALLVARGAARSVARSVDLDGPDDNIKYLPPWFALLLVANIILFFPVYIYIQYTLGNVYPVLAIIEDENPPAYEPVSLNEEAQPGAASVGQHGGTPVTASIRATDRLMASTGGLFARFRGIFVLAVAQFSAAFLADIFTGVIGSLLSPVGSLLALLATVQFSTGWVHIVMSHPTEKSNWKRIPSFKRTFDATWQPMVLYWAAFEITRWIPMLLGFVLNYHLPKLTDRGDGLSLEVHDGDIWKAILLLATRTILSFVILIPAKIVLFRIQASLLPEDDDPVVPFDRSFQQQVDPAVVDGKGYATMAIAWSTLTPSALRRIVRLQVKIIGVMIGFMLLWLLVWIPQVFLAFSLADKNKGAN